MKNQRLSFRLNRYHISQFIIIIAAILVFNFFLVRKLLFIEVSQNLYSSCKNLQERILDKKNEVESLSIVIAKLAKSENPDYTLLEDFLDGNWIMENVMLFELQNDNFEISYRFVNNSMDTIDASIIQQMLYQFVALNTDIWWQGSSDSVSGDYYSHYFKIFDSNKVLAISQSRNSYFKYFSDFNIQKQGFPIIFNYDSTLIFHPLMNDSMFNIHGNIPVNFLSQISASDLKQLKATKEGITVKNIFPHKRDERYLSYVIFDQDIDWYLTVNQPYSVVYRNMKKYIRNSGYWFIVVILLVIFLVYFTNRRISEPFRKLVISVRNNKYVNLKYSEKENEATVIRKGIDVLQNQLSYYIQNREKSSKSESKLISDLKLAKRLQKNMLPARYPAFPNRKEIDIYAISESAFDIGGDLYDFFFIDENRLLFAVGDVAGKGITASLFMIFTHSILRSIAQQQMSSNDIIESLNNRLLEENVSDLFVTMFLAILDVKTGELTYTNAAHCAPFLIHGDGRIETLAETHGIPIGIYPNRNYKMSSHSLMPDDTLFVYTDGLTDSKDENGLTYTEDVLQFNLVGTWFLEVKELVEKIESSVISFRGTVDSVDDMTLLAIKYAPKAIKKRP